MGGASSAANQSALSKQLDFATTARSAAGRTGTAVQDSMKQVLWAIAAARQDEVSIDVTGMDEFDIDDFSTELDDAQKLLDLGIHQRP